MKGMPIVVALGADGAKLLLQFLGAHNLGHGFYLFPPNPDAEPGSPP
jgi:hypothetical protein